VTWRSAYIWDIFVLKTHRRRGIGEALLNETITYLKSIGKDKVGLLVNYRNNIAKRFSEHRGFKPWSRFLIKNI
jgi:GNAT superfamily N-acetyltransferase